MNENDIQKRLANDNNLREAINRSEQKLPTMPTDINERLMMRINGSENTSKRRYLPFITISIAVAASLLLFIVFHFGKGQTEMVPKEAVHQTVKVENVQKSYKESVPVEVSKKPMVAQKNRVSIPSKRSKSKTKQTNVPESNVNTTTENLDFYIARLEAEMDNLDDSVSSAQVEKIIAADARLQQLVYRIVGKQTEQAIHEIQKDSTANYINF